MGTTGLEPIQPGIDSGDRTRIKTAKLRSRGAPANVYSLYHRGSVEQVVQHQQGVDHHEDGVGQTAVVWRGGRQRLDATNDVVPDIPYCPAGEAGQTWHLDRRVPAHGLGQVVQRSHIGILQLPSGARGPSGALPSLIPKHLGGIGGKKGVPGPALASLQRFEQKSVPPLVKLGERGDRSVAIQQDLMGDGNHPARASAFREGVVAGPHWGAATRYWPAVAIGAVR